MRLTKLLVDAFKVIKRAEMDFGPGLNILYGPNDLGKSTIATAIRAALLVPPGSAEAQLYTSWFGPDSPHVELTLVDPDGHFWRVKKTFGTSSPSSAELLHSKDSITFTQDCKARQVEEKLRAILGWGIPAPGGKTGPRGAPTSFLANALLATQTNVDDILQRSISDDLDDSGKLRLTKALSTLAQDPLFKEVLGIAQREVDLFFTDTGRRKRGQSSRFKEADEKVKSLKAELGALARQLEDSSAIEKEVNDLREARSHALVRIDEANANLAVVENRFKNSAARTEVEKSIAEAKAALAGIDAAIKRLSALTVELGALDEGVKKQEAVAASAGTACDGAQAAVRAAEEAHRIATSEDSERERELRRAQLAERVSDLAAGLLTLGGKKTEIVAAIKARDDARHAQSAVTSAKATLAQAVKNREHARQEFQTAVIELEIGRAIVAFVRWRGSLSAIEEATKAKDAALSTRSEADKKDTEATALEKKAAKSELKLAKVSESLPSAEQVKALLQLERDLEKAEAALGGGISVAVRPSAAVAIRATVDQQPAEDVEISTDRTFEAERTMRLAIADLLEVDITAGSAEKRKSVEALRIRWRDEALPVLSRANVTTRMEVEDLLTGLKRDQVAVVEQKRTAERLRTEAKGLQEQAKIHEGTAGMGAVALEEVETRRLAIGTHDIQRLEEQYRTLGNPPESKAEILHQALAEEHRALQGELAALEQKVTMAEYQLSEALKRAAELETQRDAKTAALQSKDLDGLQAETVEQLHALEKEQSETASRIEALVAEASSKGKKTQAALLHAQEAHRIAKESRDRGLAALDASRVDCSARKGALHEIRLQVDKLDRNAAMLLVQKREAELTAFPIEPPASVVDVESARSNVQMANREHDRAKEELNMKEGALSKVGGAALREEVERIEEARVAAETRERELEVDADAWKLLRDTLREVENDEGAHLGRALAGPVTARFEELTAGRYRGLRLDATLKAEAIEAMTTSASGDEVLHALSVGTRDQLAALIRLTIADQLKSTIVLDDHLVHSDPDRLLWFRNVLQRTAVNTQVIVLTCRAEDYLALDELPVGAPFHDAAAGTIRAINVAQALSRWVP